MNDLADPPPPPATAHAFQLADAQGIDLGSQQVQFFVGRRRGLVDIGRDLEVKAGSLADLFDGHARMVAAQAHPAGGIVEHAQVADQQAGSGTIARATWVGHAQPTDEIELLSVNLLDNQLK